MANIDTEVGLLHTIFRVYLTNGESSTAAAAVAALGVLASTVPVKGPIVSAILLSRAQEIADNNGPRGTKTKIKVISATPMINPQVEYIRGQF